MKFDERFWITIVVVVIAIAFDTVVYLVPTRLDANLVSVILTAVNLNGFVVAVQYWLGSSKSSQEKDSTIATLSKGP